MEVYLKKKRYCMKKLIAVSFLLFAMVLCAGCVHAEGETEARSPAPSQSAAPASRPPSEDPEDTPSPAPATKIVSSAQMTLNFYFGERTGVYSGETLNGLPHGTGSFSAQNNEGISWTYEGAWVKGHMDGEGTTLWDDGFKETGTYVNDYLDGRGAEYQDGILLYEGNYKNSIYHGQGKLLNITGKTMYEGNFSNGFVDEPAEAREARLAPFMEQCPKIEFEEYANNIQAYIGKDIQIAGKVFDVWQPEEGEEYYCDLLIYDQENTNSILRVVYIYSLNEAAIQDETTVNIWGTIRGLYTYTTEDGRELTVPEIEAWNIAI